MSGWKDRRMDAQAVARDLRSWRQQFEAGRVKGGLFGPKVEAGERLAASLGTVVVTDTERQMLDDDMEVALRPDGLGGPAAGSAFATSERLVVQRQHGRTTEWPWSEVYSAQILPRGAGVAVQPFLDDPRVTLVGPSSRGRFIHHQEVMPVTDPQERLTLWLRVEAAFVAASSAEALDEWFDDLPRRLLAA
jgi:hypothetical protein